MSILKPEKDGKTSVKRVVGLVLVFVGLALGVVDQFTDYKVTFAVWSTIFGTGAALIGVTAFPNIKQ